MGWGEALWSQGGGLPNPSQELEGRERPPNSPELPLALNLRAQKDFGKMGATVR